MKKIILSLLLIIILSQQNLFCQKIELIGNRFYINNQKTSVQEVKKLLSVNPNAKQKFEMGRTKSTMGIIFFTAGTGLVVADLIKVSNTFGASYPTVKSIVGLGFIGASIPIYINHKKRIREGLEIYNNGIPEAKTSFEYKIINNQNGLGLSLSF